MRDYTPVSTLSDALAHAAYEGFDSYNYQDRDWEAYRNGNKDAMVTKTRKHTDYDLTVAAMFPQTWGSTALGFGGIGGAAMTTAYTIVIHSSLTDQYCVYFGGGFAYRIERPNEQFFVDMFNQNMEYREHAKKRYERTE